LDHKNLSYYRAFFKTPPLWIGELEGLRQFVLPELNFENLEMGRLPSNVRLGHKIEHIFLKLIQHSTQYNVIAHNIPIRKEKTSLGEIDFLLQDVDSHKFMHVELTYKFYVVTGEATKIECQLIGPNRSDSFLAKKERIVNHQIPLLRTPEATSVLQGLHIRTSELLHRVCFKSQIFIPFTTREVDLAPFNSDCICGRWIPLQQFKSPWFLEQRYYLPSKPEWLLEPHQGVDWLGHNEILDLISIGLENKKSPLLWMQSADFTIEKLFIVWW
tara:strand:+ start:1024 stop:1839 length:816 start_codon:yes stop_codon:yes gene_type:complete